MPRRPLTLVAVAVAVLGLGAGCADEVSPALRIDDTTISNDDLLAEVDEWMGNPAAIDPTLLAEQPPGSYPGDLVRQLIQQRIDFVLHAEEFAAQGLEVTPDLLDEARTVLFGDPSLAEESFAAFSERFADEFLADVARQIGLESALGAEAYGEWRSGAYADVDIEVNPRYGRWDTSTEQVVAPSAPTQTTASSTP